MKHESELSVLLVCMGNICRSPMAHGMLREGLRLQGLEHRVHVDSAGTHGYHKGAPPDPRAREVMRMRGIEIGDLRARPVRSKDLERFDLVLAMDDDNLRELRALADEPHAMKPELYLSYSQAYHGRSVPDPYYGGRQGFEKVLAMVEDATEGLIRELRSRLG